MCIRDRHYTTAQQGLQGFSAKNLKISVQHFPALIFHKIRLEQRAMLPGGGNQQFRVEAGVLGCQHRVEHQGVPFPFQPQGVNQRNQIHFSKALFRLFGGLLDDQAVGIVAVSYTHLDVYKRQPHTHSSCCAADSKL